MWLVHGTIRHRIARNVRFGSTADIASRLGFVRFTPESGHRATRRACPLCAHSDVYAPQQSGLSPDTVRSTIGFSVRCTADVSASSPLYRFDRPGGGATPRRPKKLIEPANKL